MLRAYRAENAARHSVLVCLGRRIVGWSRHPSCRVPAGFAITHCPRLDIMMRKVLIASLLVAGVVLSGSVLAQAAAPAPAAPAAQATPDRKSTRLNSSH